MKTYRSGAEANTTPASNRTFFLPKMSDSDPAGRLIKTPGTVEAAAITPIKASGVPKLSANGFNTGFLDMVELRMANAPMTHKVKKNASLKP